jgi:hypothetical protein
MFKLTYHRDVLAKTDSDHPYVKQALAMLPQVEKAMQDLINGQIDVDQYIKLITPYDRFMWEKWHEKPQKSNPINVGQNKKYSSWREQKWAPIFELIRQHLTTQEDWNLVELVVIQNQSVVETIYSNGYMAFKDADGGLAIKVKINDMTVLLPVVVTEDKGGNACATCFGGVNAQALRLHLSFPHAKHVFITDNNVGVGITKGAQIMDNINLLVLERGQNRVKEIYPSLCADRFKQVLEGLKFRLSTSDPKTFLDYKVVSTNTNKTLREQTDSTGLVWNW